MSIVNSQLDGGNALGLLAGKRVPIAPVLGVLKVGGHQGQRQGHFHSANECVCLLVLVINLQLHQAGLGGVAMQAVFFALVNSESFHPLGLMSCVRVHLRPRQRREWMEKTQEAGRQVAGS